MRNVLFVVNYKGASEGSFMRALTALGEEIEREGNKAVYLLPNKCKKYDWAKKLVAGGDSVYYFSDSFSGFLKTVRTIKKIIKSFKVEIIHSFFMTARLHLAVALACSGNKNIDHIIQLNQPLSGKRSFKEKAAFLLHEPALYIAESDTVKNSVTIEGKRAVKILNSVDFPRLEAVDADFDRQSLSIDPQKKTLFVFGPGIRDKGIDFIIDTIKEYDSENRLILLIAVKDTGKAQKETEDIFGEVPGFVRLLPERNDIATYFNISDIYILPRYTQGSPYTMIESAYLGVPIIYCDDENKNELGIPWSVNIEYGAKKELYDAVCGIIDEDENESAQMSLDAKEYVVNNYSLGKWVYDIIYTYKNIYKI
ncbi:MAG: glycosyltransferase family 4 protein [Clostridia bacterium]|nr:glycosyltransferase family 4 protein [Clostridia bacterium]